MIPIFLLLMVPSFWCIHKQNRVFQIIHRRMRWMQCGMERNQLQVNSGWGPTESSMMSCDWATISYNKKVKEHLKKLLVSQNLRDKKFAIGMLQLEDSELDPYTNLLWTISETWFTYPSKHSTTKNPNPEWTELKISNDIDHDIQLGIRDLVLLYLVS